MPEMRKRPQATTGQVWKKAGGRCWRQMRYEHCGISLEGRKGELTALVWPSPSEACMEGDHPATIEESAFITTQHKMHKCETVTTH